MTDDAQPGLPPVVIVATPYAGRVMRNVFYAQQAMLDSIQRGEAPFLSHLLYTQVLRDDLLEERRKGLLCERAWLSRATLLAVYRDLGISEGMQQTILRAKSWNIPVEERRLTK